MRMSVEAWEMELFDRYNGEYVSESEIIADIYAELEADLCGLDYEE